MIAWFLHHMLKCSGFALVTLLIRELCFKKVDARYRLFIWLPLALTSLIPYDLFRIPVSKSFDYFPAIDNFAPYLIGIYGVGVFALLSTYILKTIRLHRLLKRNQKILVLDDFPYPIYVSEKVENALVIRSFSGYMLYINPEYLADISFSRPIMYHELGHIKQHASLWGILQAILLILNWYNPLFWYCSAQVSLDFECAADAWAIERIGRKQSLNYAKTLIHLHAIAGIKNANNLSYANSFFRSRKEINQRLLSLSFEKKSEQIPLGLILILFLMLLLSVTGFTSKDVLASRPAVLPPYQRPIISTH